MTKEKKGMMFVLSSPSGAGKTTLTKKLAEHNSQFVISISHTTRKSRPNEFELTFRWAKSISGVNSVIARNS